MPSYNAVDPVNDAKYIYRVEWTNPLSLITVLGFYALWGTMMFYTRHQENKSARRREILESFGCAEIEEPPKIFTSKWQVLRNRMYESAKNEHKWISAFCVKYDNPFDRYMRITICLNVVMATGVMSSLFYGVEYPLSSPSNEDSGDLDWDRIAPRLMIGILSSLFIVPNILIFVFVFRKAGQFRALLQTENEIASRPDWLSQTQ